MAEITMSTNSVRENYSRRKYEDAVHKPQHVYTYRDYTSVMSVPKKTVSYTTALYKAPAGTRQYPGSMGRRGTPLGALPITQPLIV